MFDKIIEHLKSCGLVKKGGKQRIDSTHIIGCVRELSRVELLHETLRLFCLDVEDLISRMDNQLVEAHGKYSEKISLYGITDLQKKEFIRNAGMSMKAFISWSELSLHSIELQKLKSLSTLKTVFEQNFTDNGTAPELIKVSTGAGHISSPHETQACYANKGKKSWVGYKGQVVETVKTQEDKIPNFITHIDLEEATNFDGDCVIPLVQELKNKDIAPESLYGDTHYNTSDNIESLKNDAIELKGPVQPISREKAEKNAGFQVDVENQKVICPTGSESKHFHADPNGKIGASFPTEDCAPCPRRGICQPEPRGKYYTAKSENKILIQRRVQMKDPSYLKDLRKRNGIEGCISGLVQGQTWRHCRYRGKSKAQLQTKFTGAASNVLRLHRYRLLQQQIIEIGCQSAA